MAFRYIGGKALTKVKVNKPRLSSDKLSVSWKKCGKARKYKIMMSNDKSFMAKGKKISKVSWIKTGVSCAEKRKEKDVEKRKKLYS